MPPHPTSWRSILILSSHLHLVPPSGLFPSCFPTKFLYKPLLSPIRTTCPTHLNLLYLINWTILGEEYISLSSSLCSFLHSPLKVGPLAVPHLKQMYLIITSTHYVSTCRKSVCRYMATDCCNPIFIIFSLMFLYLPVFIFCVGPHLLCGAGSYPPNVLQPTEAYCTNPALVPPFISRGAPLETTWKASISERRNYGREMTDQI
jgi:hypothetical protein